MIDAMALRSWSHTHARQLVSLRSIVSSYANAVTVAAMNHAKSNGYLFVQSPASLVRDADNVVTITLGSDTRYFAPTCRVCVLQADATTTTTKFSGTFEITSVDPNAKTAKYKHVGRAETADGTIKVITANWTTSLNDAKTDLQSIITSLADKYDNLSRIGYENIWETNPFPICDTVTGVTPSASLEFLSRRNRMTDYADLNADSPSEDSPSNMKWMFANAESATRLNLIRRGQHLAMLSMERLLMLKLRESPFWSIHRWGYAMLRRTRAIELPERLATEIDDAETASGADGDTSSVYAAMVALKDGFTADDAPIQTVYGAADTVLVQYLQLFASLEAIRVRNRRYLTGEQSNVMTRSPDWTVILGAFCRCSDISTSTDVPSESTSTSTSTGTPSESTSASASGSAPSTSSDCVTVILHPLTATTACVEGQLVITFEYDTASVRVC